MPVPIPLLALQCLSEAPLYPSWPWPTGDKLEKKALKENTKDAAQLFTGIMEGLHEIQACPRGRGT